MICLNLFSETSSKIWNLAFSLVAVRKRQQKEQLNYVLHFSSILCKHPFEESFPSWKRFRGCEAGIRILKKRKFLVKRWLLFSFSLSKPACNTLATLQARVNFRIIICWHNAISCGIEWMGSGWNPFMSIVYCTSHSLKFRQVIQRASVVSITLLQVQSYFYLIRTKHQLNCLCSINNHPLQHIEETSTSIYLIHQIKKTWIDS